MNVAKFSSQTEPIKMFVFSSGGSEPLGVSKSDFLRGIITEKLSTAAREILAVVERTVADYEEEGSGFRQEIDRQRRQLELLQPQVTLHRGDLHKHEEMVVGEEPEEQQLIQTDVEEAESQNHGDDDDDGGQDDDDDDHIDDEEPETTSSQNQEEIKELKIKTSSSSGSSVRRSTGPEVSHTEDHLSL
ncbi:histone H2A.Z-specific chaperone CHZ1, partial [Austrofundulus limnaeus]|uniref:Histone H2A.Z-specific chaperone CHZ1 n=1 Tax=Austrofundulus limnaeus TaxID=52670 RepID=A0A2I4CIN3_AUSLI